MKKNIVIIILILINTTLLIYSYVRAGEAAKNKEAAMMYQVEAMKNAEEARKQGDLALEAAERATRAMAEAEKIKNDLANCQNQ